MSQTAVDSRIDHSCFSPIAFRSQFVAMIAALPLVRSPETVRVPRFSRVAHAPGAAELACLHARNWPQAAVRAVDRLVSGEALQARNPRSIDVTHVWQQLTTQLGFPEQPPGDACAATLGMLLERAA
ncbi:oxidoreductase [Burkholderia aenigmatica]|uniref:Oxidoreductase n=2 Tax=Burkholderia TaxID=32008 RepID=A0A6J5INC2_9BURK|nr:oxidoreductase [Burkholderia aenigmatica]